MNTPLAQHHQLHGVQPVLPVPDLLVAMALYQRVLGFELDFTHGDPPSHGHGRVKLGDGSWGDSIYIHLQQHAVNAGSAVVMQPTEQPWGSLLGRPAPT